MTWAFILQIQNSKCSLRKIITDKGGYKKDLYENINIG